MKNIVTGILAHVDAGKTTLAESLLYQTGAIRTFGNIDKQTTQLDFDSQERERGITIYTKEAGMEWNGLSIQLIDTPGHADFSAEMERSLDVLDGAILVISGLDGVQAHTRTIWKLLEAHHIPVILFVNKMDITHREKEELLSDIQKHLSSLAAEPTDENLALSDDRLLETWMETGELPEDTFSTLVQSRAFFPVYFGSALKRQGIEAVLSGLESFHVPYTKEAFGALVYKVNGEGAHVKVTGGTLVPKQELSDGLRADQIFVWKAAKTVPVSAVSAGQVCLVKTSQPVEAGTGFGAQENQSAPTLLGNMAYEMLLPEGADPLQVAPALAQLSREDAALSLESDHKRIRLCLMGPIQMEVLQKRMKELTGLDVTFGPGQPVYMETITAPVEGYGHFEPLRHYAEVHVRLEPADRFSVISQVPNGMLSNAWHTTVLNALSSIRHKGVLTGSALTNVKIVLTSAKVHQKHTSAGDLRQAALRAVRQALMKADNVLLEPVVSFAAEVPETYIGNVLYELEKLGCESQVTASGVQGTGPAAPLSGFQNELRALTKGAGIWSAVPAGYAPAAQAEEIIRQKDYDPEADLKNPPGSVFCANGSGYQVPWDEVEELLHIPLRTQGSAGTVRHSRYVVSEEESKRVFAQLSGRNRNEKKQVKPRKKKEGPTPQNVEMAVLKPVCLVVDGYNMMHEWGLAGKDLHQAREEIISRLQDYQGARDIRVVLVFDGWKRQDNAGLRERRGALEIVYTRTGQSADSWIERFCHDNKEAFRLEVASSDGLIQNSVLSHGARRLSARELERNMQEKKSRTRELIKAYSK